MSTTLYAPYSEQSRNKISRTTLFLPIADIVEGPPVEVLKPIRIAPQQFPYETRVASSTLLGETIPFGINLFLQFPLKQTPSFTYAPLRDSRFIRVPIADPIVITVDIYKPLRGIVQSVSKQRNSFVITPPTPAVPVLTVDILKPLKKPIEQPIVAVGNSQLFGEYVFPVPVAPPDFLFRKPLRIIAHTPEQPKRGSYFVGEYVFPVSPPVPLDYVVLRSVSQPQAPQYRSIIISDLVETLPVVAGVISLVPLRAPTRSIEHVQISSMFMNDLVGSPPPDPTTLLLIQERQLRQAAKPIQAFRRSQILIPIRPDNVPTFLNIITGVRRDLSLVSGKSRSIGVLTADPDVPVSGNVFVVIPNTPGAVQVHVRISHSTKIRTVIDSTAPKVIMVSDPAAIPVEVII